MSEPKHGVGAAVAEAAKGEVVGAPTGENPAGAAPGLPFEDLAGPPDAESPLGNLAAARRGKGRPAGAQNRMTRDIRKLILSQHRHPLLVLAEIMSLDTRALASHLECKPVEALDRQIRAAQELAPYLAAKQAAVDDHGQAVMPVLNLNFGGPAPTVVEASGGSGALSILDLMQVQQDQGLSTIADDASHEDASHEEG